MVKAYHLSIEKYSQRSKNLFLLQHFVILGRLFLGSTFVQGMAVFIPIIFAYNALRDALL